MAPRFVVLALLSELYIVGAIINSIFFGVILKQHTDDAMVAAVEYLLL